MPVTANAEYPGRLNTDWSGEVWIRDEVLAVDTVVIHASLWDPIPAFRAQETCFYRNGFVPYGYVYAAILPAGTRIAVYPRGEIRVTLTANIEIYDIGVSRAISTWDPRRRKYVDTTVYEGPISQWVDQATSTIAVDPGTLRGGL